MSQAPINPYANFEYTDEVKTAYSNNHCISHTNKEFILTFGCHHPPHNKVQVVAQVIMTERHLLELEMNIKKQLAKYRAGGQPPATPPRG